MNRVEKVSLLIVDDHGVLRSGLRALLEVHGEFQVIGEAANGEEALDRVRELNPQVVLLDLAMPGMDGLTTMRRMLRNHPDVKVLVVTQHADRAYLLPALQAGASGYLLKSSTIEDIVSALHSVCRGKVFLDPSVASVVLDDYRQRGMPGSDIKNEELSEREQEVLRLCAWGFTSREIADKLIINTKTVDSHKSRMMSKLGIKTRSELVAYAFKHGILPQTT
jgi:DNA-binding NarL/FixJ family response regulator